MYYWPHFTDEKIETTNLLKVTQLDTEEQRF